MVPLAAIRMGAGATSGAGAIAATGVTGIGAGSRAATRDGMTMNFPVRSSPGLWMLFALAISTLGTRYLSASVSSDSPGPTRTTFPLVDDQPLPGLAPESATGGVSGAALATAPVGGARSVLVTA